MKTFVPLAFVVLLGAIVLCSGQLPFRTDYFFDEDPRDPRFMEAAQKIFSGKNHQSSDVAVILSAESKDSDPRSNRMLVRFADWSSCHVTYQDNRYDRKREPMDVSFYCMVPHYPS